MGKNRMEAFSDGVLAISIASMVLEMKVPHGEGLAALRPLVPVLLSCVLSFIYIGIYWNNHHLVQAIRRTHARRCAPKIRPVPAATPAATCPPPG